MITGVIFDLDGTLLDSNGFWNLAPGAYLRTQGKVARDGLAKTVFSMTVPEAAEYLIREYGLNRTREEIVAGIDAAMERFYLNEIPMKEGAEEGIRTLAAMGVPMAVASATDGALVKAALRRFGLTDDFACVVSTEDVGVGKNEPDVYLKAAEMIGSAPENTLVFEDALYALKTANRAGFQTVGVYDEASDDEQEEIRRESRFYLRSLAELGALFGQSGR